MVLNTKPANTCQLDFLSLGECMLRLSPPDFQRLEFAQQLEIYVGGAEYNVAYALARFGMRAGWVSRLPAHPLSSIILNHARAAGMDVSEVELVEYDGMGKENRLGLNFVEVGAGARPSRSLYDRGHSAASAIKPGDVDWQRIFAERGVRWFHTGGIFTALSSSSVEVVKEAMQAAQQTGTLVSYDLNYRSRLWTSQQAIAATRPLIRWVDVLFGNEEDFQKVLGFEVKGIKKDYTDLKIDSYKAMVRQVMETYPHLKAVATTFREAVSPSRNHWSAMLYHNGRFYQSRVYRDLEIVDRVGGGDGFCSGLIYALLHGFDAQEAVDFGTAHGALVQSTRGDTSMISLEEVKHLAAGGSFRIQR